MFKLRRKWYEILRFLHFIKMWSISSAKELKINISLKCLACFDTHVIPDTAKVVDVSWILEYFPKFSYTSAA